MSDEEEERVKIQHMEVPWTSTTRNREREIQSESEKNWTWKNLENTSKAAGRRGSLVMRERGVEEVVKKHTMGVPWTPQRQLGSVL